MRLKALVGATLLALAASATFAWRPTPQAAAPVASGIPAPTQIAALQAQAEQACRCARTRSDATGKQDCWAGFERAIAPWPHGQTTTMCEFSLDGICFGDGFGSGACVTKGWSGPVGGLGSICTQEELQTAEAVWIEALDQHEKNSRSERPQQALKRTLAAFARNDRVALEKSSGGCGGG